MIKLYIDSHADKSAYGGISLPFQVFDVISKYASISVGTFGSIKSVR